MTQNPVVVGADYVLITVLALIATLVFGAAAACVIYYGRVLKATGTRKYGLLLWHIVTIAGSVAGTWGMLLLGQLDSLDIFTTPRSFRLIGYSFFGLTTVAAIGIIALTQYRRVREGAPTVGTCTGEVVIHGDDDAPPAAR